MFIILFHQLFSWCNPGSLRNFGVLVQSNRCESNISDSSLKKRCKNRQILYGDRINISCVKVFKFSKTSYSAGYWLETWFRKWHRSHRWTGFYNKLDKIKSVCLKSWVRSVRLSNGIVAYCKTNLWAFLNAMRYADIAKRTVKLWQIWEYVGSSLHSTSRMKSFSPQSALPVYPSEFSGCWRTY